MDQEIVIMLSDREAYFLSRAASQWQKGTRHLYGVFHLSDKIYDQLLKGLTAQRLAELQEGWEEAKEKSPHVADQPKKVKVKPALCPHRVPGDCALCKAHPSKKNLKKIRRKKNRKVL